MVGLFYGIKMICRDWYHQKAEPAVHLAQLIRNLHAFFLTS